MTDRQLMPGNPPELHPREARSSASVRHRHAIVLAAVLLLGALLRLPTFARPVLSDDEAIYATTADAMRRGDVLYRDVVDHKPPAIYDVYLAGFLALGPYNTQGAHALVVLAVLLCALALARAARHVSRDGRAGPIAALLWLVFSTAMLDYDGLAANCELFLVALQAVAFAWLLGAAAGSRRALAAWLGAGILAGAATMFKYQGATFLAVLAAAAVLDGLRRRRAGAAAALLALAVAGCAVVPALYLLRAWHAGGLAAMWYWFTFNFSYIEEGPRGLRALWHALIRIGMVGGIAAFLPYACGSVGAVQSIGGWTRRALRGRGPGRCDELDGRLLAAVWLASSVVALCAGGRFFGHYFHHVLPALALLAAEPVLSAWDGRPRLRPVVAGLVVVPMLVFLACATVLREGIIARTDPKPPYGLVAARLRELSRPDDRVFLWGNSPQLYVLARRPMGTRFSFCNYMTGVSPGTDTETGLADPRPNVLAASWGMLAGDLDRRKPRWLVDAAAGGWDEYAPFQLARYPRLAARVRSDYVERDRVDGVVIYERSAP